MELAIHNPVLHPEPVTHWPNLDEKDYTIHAPNGSAYLVFLDHDGIAAVWRKSNAMNTLFRLCSVKTWNQYMIDTGNKDWVISYFPNRAVLERMSQHG